MGKPLFKVLLPDQFHTPAAIFLPLWTRREETYSRLMNNIVLTAVPSRKLGAGVAQLLRMSKNNNPQTRPGSARRKRPKPQASSPAPAVEVKQSKLRRFLPTVLIPHGVAVLLVVVAAVAALMFSAASMVALPATIAQLWLALNMSAVSGSGEVIGVIPMIPALLLVWAVARRVHRSVKKRVSIADLAVLSVLVLAIPLSLTGIASAMLYDASGVLDVDIPPIPGMVGKVLLLHASALFLGMGPRLWRALARRYGAPEWFVDSITLAIRFLVTYGVVACLGILLMVAVNHQIFADTLTGYEESSAVPALLLLSLLYLPNMVIYAMGVLVGAPLYFGEGSISLFNVDLVPLPPLPILAAIPASASQWAVIGLLIPATVAAWVGIKNPMRLIVTLTSGVFGAFFFLVLGILAGGSLGVYGPVGLNLLPAVGLLFGNLVIVGALIAGIDRLRASAKTPPAAPTEHERAHTPPLPADMPEEETRVPEGGEDNEAPTDEVDAVEEDQASVYIEDREDGAEVAEDDAGDDAGDNADTAAEPEPVTAEQDPTETEDDPALEQDTDPESDAGNDVDADDLVEEAETEPGDSDSGVETEAGTNRETTVGETNDGSTDKGS